MKKNPLLLTLAVSALAPNAMAQSVDATSKIANPGFEEGESGWNVDDGFVVRSTTGEDGITSMGEKYLRFINNTPGTPTKGKVWQEVKNLPAGKYTVTAESGAAAGAGTSTLVVGTTATMTAYAEGTEVTVEQGKSLWIGYELNEFTGAWAAVDEFKLKLSEESANAVRKALTEALTMVINKTKVGTGDNDYITDATINALMTESSVIQKQINDLTFDAYADYKANGANSEISKAIADLDVKMTAAVANKKAYDAAKSAHATKDVKEHVDALKDAYDAACGETSTNSAEYKAIAKKLYDDAMALYDGFLTDLEASYIAGNAATEFSAANVQEKLEIITEALDDATSSISGGNTNDLAFAGVQQAVAQAKIDFKGHNTTLYKNLSNEWHRVYGDWFAQATAQVSVYYQEILAVEKANEASKTAGTCDTDKAGYLTRLTTAVANTQTEVAAWVEKATKQKNDYNALQDEYIYDEGNTSEKALQNLLNAAYNSATVKNDFTAEKDGIQAKIDQLQEKLDEYNVNHNLSGENGWEGVYVTKTNTALNHTVVKTEIEKLALKISWSNAFEADKATIAAVQKAFDDTKTALAKKVSTDKKYTPAGKYPTAESNILKAINKLSADAQTNFNNRFKNVSDINHRLGQGYTYDLVTDAVEKSISSYNTTATNNFDKYAKIEDDLKKYVAAVNALDEKAENGNVTIDGQVGSESYATFIDSCRNDIAVATAAMDAAIALKDGKHTTAITNLKLIDTNAETNPYRKVQVEALTTAYETNKSTWEGNQLDAAYTRVLNECIEVLGTITLDNKYTNDKVYGKKADEFANTLKALGEDKTELEAEVNKYKDVNTDAEKTAAIALLTEILADVNDIKAIYDQLKKDAEAARVTYAEEIKLRDYYLGENGDANGAGYVWNPLLVYLNGGTLNPDGENETEIEGVLDLNTDKNEGGDSTKVQKYLETKVAALNVRIIANRDSIKTSFGNETLVAENSVIKMTDDDGQEQSFDGYEKRLAGILAEINLLREQALAATDNKKAVDDMYTEFYTTKKVDETLTNCSKAVKNVYDELTAANSNYSWDEAYNNFYSGVVSAMETEAQVIEDSIDRYYGEYNAVAKKAKVIAKINDLLNRAAALPGLATNNEAAYKRQVDAHAAALDLWNTVYDDIIAQAELGATLQAKLEELADVKVTLETNNTNIEKYHNAGTSDANNAALLKSFSDCTKRIEFVAENWDEEYTTEVRAENLRRWGIFETAYNELNNRYAWVVEYVDKMNATSWADNETIKAKLAEITAEGTGLYSYADKIRALKEEADAAYKKAEAPILFYEYEELKKGADALKAAINTLYSDYSELINEAAKADYIALYESTEDALSTAISNVNSSLLDRFGMTNYSGVNDITAGYRGNLFALKQTLHNSSYDVANSKETFALKYDQIVRDLNAINSAIDGAKKQDAADVYTAKITEYQNKSAQEAQDIAGWKDAKTGVKGTHLAAYNTFIANTLTKAASRRQNVAQKDIYAEMTEESRKLNGAADATPTVGQLLKDFYGQLRTKEISNNSLTQTKHWWDARQADINWDTNDASWKLMNQHLDAIRAELDALNEYRVPLFGCNASQSVIDGIEEKIEELQETIDGYHNKYVAADNENNLKSVLGEKKDGKGGEIQKLRNEINQRANYSDETSTKTGYCAVLDKQNSAVQAQLTLLRLDYSQAEAVELEANKLQAYANTIDSLKTVAEEIRYNFTTGFPVYDENGKFIGHKTENNQVKVLTYAEAHERYLVLQEKMALTRAELVAIYDDAKYTATFNTLKSSVDAVQAKIDTQAAFEGCHNAVVNKYTDDVQALNDALETVKGMIDERNTEGTLISYAEAYTQNVESIRKAIESLSVVISDEEKEYDLHDANYNRLKNLLATEKTKFETVVAEVRAYEYLGYEDQKDALKDFNYAVTYGNKCIAEAEKWLEKQNNTANIETKNYLTASSKIPGIVITQDKNGKDVVSYDENNNFISQLKIEITTRQKNCANANVNAVIANRSKALFLADSLLYVSNYTADDKNALKATYAGLAKAFGAFEIQGLFTDQYGVTTVMTGNPTESLILAYNNDALADDKVGADINGNPYKNNNGTQKYIAMPYMTAYAEIMDTIAVQTQILEKWANDVETLKYELGDVDHKGTVDVTDWYTVRMIMLGLRVVDPSSPEFYASDVNQDGKVNVVDLTQIANYIMTGKSFKDQNTIALATARRNNTDALSAVVNGTGTHQQLVISLNNTMNYVGAQMDIVLPAGVTIANESLAERAANHELLSNDVNGAHRIAITDINNSAFLDGEKALLVIDLEVSADFAGGALEINNAIFTTAEGRGYKLQTSVGTGETGITDLTITEKATSRIYNLGGQVMKSIRKGVNIIVNSDGTSKKVLNK